MSVILAILKFLNTHRLIPASLPACLRRVTRAGHDTFAYFRQTPARRLLAQSLSILLLACASVVLMGSNGCDTEEYDLEFAKTMTHVHEIFPVHIVSRSKSRTALAHAVTRPAITGTDGSQTATASFQGNFSAIIGPPPQGTMVLVREQDCSLGLVTVSGPSDPGTTTQHYELTLHQLASLKTKADVFPHGCAEQTTGISSRPGIFVGETTTNVLVFAGVGNNGGNNAIFLYNSNNTLTSTTDTSLPSASALAVGDLNGDGNNDLVVVNGYNATSASISVMLGNTDGTFQAPVSYPIAGNYSSAAVVDDVNSDGKLDIVAISADQQISVLLGKGDGTFDSAQSFAAPPPPGVKNAASAPIVNMITADLRGIGKKDIVCSNGLVLLGKGDGTFTASPAAAFPVTQATSNEGPNLASGDINNDGKLDLVLNNGTTVSTWIGKGDGTFTPGASYASVNDTGFVTITDLDGDGNADIYVGLANGGIYSGDDSNATLAYALMGNGDGTFQGAPASGAYSGNNLGDVNGDGVPDLISNTPAGANSSSAVFTVALGNGKGVFTPVSTITAPDTFTLSGYNFTGVSTVAATSYAVADVNGDGKADLVFVDNGLTAQSSGAAFPITYPYPVYFVALGKGDGTFQQPVPHAFPQIAPAPGFDNTLTVTGLQIADFNKDDHADLIFTYNDIAGGSGVNPYLQGFVVLTGAGNGTFNTKPILTSTYSSATAPTTGNLEQVTNIADLNGDGAPDLVAVVPSFSIATGATTQVEILLGNGDGTFKAPAAVNIAANAYGIPVLADFNKDSKLDLAFLAETSSSQAELAIALGNGNGTFANATTFNLQGGDAIRSGGLAAGDFDGDGNIDLALINNAAFSGIFYGKGDATFTSVPVNGNIVPKDLINVEAGSPAIAVDLNKDNHPDILAGSVALINIYGSAPVITGSAATTTSLSASATTIAAGQNVTLTASVAPAAGTGTPTGTVTFLDGTTTLSSVALNSSAQAVLTTSSLSPGSHSITAAYGGDTQFSASTSQPVTITVQPAAPPSFAISTSATTGAISASQNATTKVTITPANGFNQAVSFSCSGLPTGVSCAFQPSKVTPDGTNPATTTVTISESAQAAVVEHGPWMRGTPLLGAVSLSSLVGFVFFFAPRKRFLHSRRGNGAMLAGSALALVCILLSIASGCGSSKKTSTPTTISITGTGGGISKSVSYDLTVN